MATTTETQGYNGWKNYETWAVNLWLTNDESSYGYWINSALDAWRQARATSYAGRSEMARLALATELKTTHEKLAETEGLQRRARASVWSDLLSAALAEVDWWAIADGLLEAEAEGYECAA